MNEPPRIATVTAAPEPAATHRSTRLAATFAVAVGTLILMIATEPKLAMVWDEGHVLGREARIRLWVRALANPRAFSESWKPPRPLEELIEDSPPPHDVPPPRANELDSRAKLLSARAMSWFWPFARYEPHGHPPFYAIVGMMGDVLAPRWADLPRARLGPMIFFSLAAGALFGGFSRRWGYWSGALASGAWVFQPQLFGMGHYAGYDALLSSLWVLAILAFSRSIREESGLQRWLSIVAFGMIAGFAADTKLTGWFLPFPFAFWTLFTRNRRGFYALSVGGLIAFATLYVFNPAWWCDPVGGVRQFFASNLSRGETINIKILFLGRVYNTPRDSLPWYNTLVWTVFATPIGYLVFAGLGAIRGLLARKTGDPLAILAILHWAFLLLLRSLPHTPGHDGIRQFLPAFGCLAMVAGVGASWVVARFGRWGKAMVIAALVEGILSTSLVMPVPLSYFSPIVGGLPGAAKLGMEPTYFWDALSPEALDRLARATPRDRSVLFATYPTSWLYLKRVGAMKFAIAKLDPPPPAWYVVQNRPGAFRPIDRRLIARLGPRYVLVEKFGVPLVWAFPYDEIEHLIQDPLAPRGAP